MKKFLWCIVFFSLMDDPHGQIVADGRIVEPEWGQPIATSTGGAVSNLGVAHQLNALYACAPLAGEIHFAIAGNLQPQHHILLFIDSKPGGFSTTSFGRDEAPQVIRSLNEDIRFTSGFQPDYCMVISSSENGDNYHFALFTLSITGGPLSLLGDRHSAFFGASPASDNFQQGFEWKLSVSDNGIGTDIQSSGNSLQMMAMYISQTGSLSNQFLNPAMQGEPVYGNMPVDFNNSAAGPVVFRNAILLPVEFTSLDIRVIAEESIIEWTVVDDAEISHYVLEESENGSVFTVLETVPSQRSMGIATYGVRDAKLNQGNNFYRVKGVADNGMYIFSRILRMPYGIPDNSIFLYPNPAREVLNLQLHGILQGEYVLHIYTNNGQEIYRQQISHDGRDRTISARLPALLNRGIYRVFLINKFQFFQQAFLVE